jgi:GNAT superfamily N-acetyltransferase
MERAEISIADPASEPARWAMQQYFDELCARLPGGFDAGDAIDAAATGYRPPLGLFAVAVREGAVIGCGALQFLDAETAEVKRMWVGPKARGQGLGKQLLAYLEEQSAKAGRRRLVLDTNGTLTEALALYAKQGYNTIERYNDNPYAQHWFEKNLT